MTAQIANPGAKLGQAIGESMEKALDGRLHVLTDNLGYHYLCSGSLINGERKKVINLYDKHGIVYQVDAVVVNHDMQPLIVFESKYIRYSKHNRDKGSWICTTHNAVRGRYQSIRKFIAILAGRWSAPSLAMVRSQDIDIYEVGFEAICGLLDDYNINFDWDERDRNSAIHAYMTYDELSEKEKDEIGEQMIKDIITPLGETIEGVLTPSSAEEVEKVSVEVRSNLGTIRRREFDSVGDAIDFLSDIDASIFDLSDAVKLTDSPPQV